MMPSFVYVGAVLWRQRVRRKGQESKRASQVPENSNFPAADFSKFHPFARMSEIDFPRKVRH